MQGEGERVSLYLFCNFFFFRGMLLLTFLNLFLYCAIVKFCPWIVPFILIFALFLKFVSFLPSIHRLFVLPAML